jgi:transcription elongation factor GreA
MNILTPAGLQKLKEKIKRAERELKETLAAKGEAAETGGNVWHDNFAFEQLVEKERELAQKLANLKDRLANIKIAASDSGGASPGKQAVEISSRVSVLLENDKEKTLIIGDPETADPKKGIVSYESPVGKALMGGKMGEEKEYSAGGRVHKIKILKIF